MMNGPYYRNRSRSVPVHKPKVVSIPVHFISSDHHQPQTNKHSSAALKIQKVFKGHTVRKALKKIVSIKNQVDEIGKRLQNDALFVKMLRNDAKERLRVNETLMSMLFKLDSVRGVENGVREVRKSVAKKAVALQEKVDTIAQTFEGDDDVSNGEQAELRDVSNEEDVVNEAMNEDSMKECDDDVRNDEEAELDDVSNGIGNEVNEEDAKEDVVDHDVSNDQKTELCDVSNGIQIRVNADVVDDDDVSKKNRDQELAVNNEAMNEDSMKECDYDVSRNNVDSIGQTFEDYVDDVSNEEFVKDVVVDDDVSNNVGNQESVDNREDVKESLMKICYDDVSRSCCDQEMAVDEDQKCGDDDIIKRCCDKGMVEKLVSDNAKMMRLMIQISERNEMQTRMINSLSKRVEQLEKAFIVSDKSRRRKKSYTRREKDGFCI
ncbi:IQ motif, EF-hand binding site, BAG domain protein [Tanacetum coccineum]|uniref:IQ motif, EF-hand binding site, BAG domain protein n=1 Tax=Tanacetum coccineum TaxID=301880 RepID=A0ABQ5EYC9_9ASTR